MNMIALFAQPLLIGFAMWKILTFLQVVQIVEADLNGSYLYRYI